MISPHTKDEVMQLKKADMELYSDLAKRDFLGDPAIATRPIGVLHIEAQKGRYLQEVLPEWIADYTGPFEGLKKVEESFRVQEEAIASLGHALFEEMLVELSDALISEPEYVSVSVTPITVVFLESELEEEAQFGHIEARVSIARDILNQMRELRKYSIEYYDRLMLLAACEQSGTELEDVA